MRKQCITILTFLSLFGCSKSESNKINLKTPEKFYNCETIEHYFFEVSDKDAYLFRRQNKTADEKKFNGILTGYYPKNMDVKNLENDLVKLNFKKTILSKKDKSIADEIFSKKDSVKTEFSSCTPIYRDILLFKNQDSIVGIAKICFGCGVSSFLGADYSKTEGFGLQSDLEKLKKIIRK